MTDVIDQIKADLVHLTSLYTEMEKKHKKDRETIIAIFGELEKKVTESQTKQKTLDDGEHVKLLYHLKDKMWSQAGMDTNRDARITHLESQLNDLRDDQDFLNGRITKLEKK